MLCQLSYVGSPIWRLRRHGAAARRSRRACPLCLYVEPERGFEPLTCRLQIGCAAIAPPGHTARGSALAEQVVDPNPAEQKYAPAEAGFVRAQYMEAQTNQSSSGG